MIRKRNGSAQAFTIVELLIVIVVIGILAAITIVAFNGVQNKARIAGLQSTLESSLKQIENARTTAGTNTYPTTAPTDLASGVTYYSNATLGGFCASKTDGGLTYMITSTNTVAHTGPTCSATNLTNLITNPSIETVTTNWGAQVNAILSRSTTYASSGIASLQVARTATAGNGYILTSMATTAGKKYSLSFDVRSVSGSPALVASVKNTTATGTTPADATTLSFSPTSSFTRYTLTWTAEVATTYFVLDAPAATSVTYAIDAIMAVEGDNSSTYTDPTISGGVWTWTGASYISSSTGPAF
jgi:prepilin-type N-terminal cleavage/methylation domain-containing protein